MKILNLIIALTTVFMISCQTVSKDQAAGASNPAVGNDSAASTKTYVQMSEEEKIKFIAEQSDKILEIFGRTDGDRISAKGLNLIRKFVDEYAKRLSPAKIDKCRFGDDLSTLMTRGAKYSKAIDGAFSGEGQPGQLGIYTAMIKTEFCPCIQSGTGQLGMFQFSSKEASGYGLKTVSGASENKPDERCEPEPAARAMANKYKSIVTKDFERQFNSIGYTLALSAGNDGEEMIKENYDEALRAANGEKTSFWTLLERQDKLRSSSNYPKDFQAYTYNFTLQFFAAAIVGENPRQFGVNIPALSQSNN